jgi:hypothetical protein
VAMRRRVAVLMDEERTEKGGAREHEPSVARSKSGPGSARAPTLKNKPLKLTDEDLRNAIKRVGRPWRNRRKRIAVWKIREYRREGFSYRQIGEIYSVSATTIKRRLRGD